MPKGQHFAVDAEGFFRPATILANTELRQQRPDVSPRALNRQDIADEMISRISGGEQEQKIFSSNQTKSKRERSKGRMYPHRCDRKGRHDARAECRHLAVAEIGAMGLLDRRMVHLFLVQGVPETCLP